MIFVDVAMRVQSKAVLEEIMPKIKAAMAGTHKEKGCLIYRFTIDLDDPCVLRVTELWESEEDLFAHFEGEPVKIMMELMPLMEVLHMDPRKGDLTPFELPLPEALRS